MRVESLNAITDKVLAHQRTPTGPLKVIAGTPHHPLVIGDIETSCLCPRRRDQGPQSAGVP